MPSHFGGRKFLVVQQESQLPFPNEVRWFLGCRKHQSMSFCQPGFLIGPLTFLERDVFFLADLLDLSPISSQQQITDGSNFYVVARFRFMEGVCKNGTQLHI